MTTDAEGLKQRYKHLRDLCTQGKESQNKIYDECGIQMPLEEPEEYIKYLINLCVANPYTSQKVLEILPSIECSGKTLKLLIILSNTIVCTSAENKDRFIAENKKIIGMCIKCVLQDSEELFEWGFYLLSNLHVGRLEALHKSLDGNEFEALVQFILTKLEKAWEGSESFIPKVITIDDIKYICSLSIPSQYSLLTLINYATREVDWTSLISSILFQSGALLTCYELLSQKLEEGYKSIILQIIANTLNPENIQLLVDNTKAVLKSAELDASNPTTREWVFVIIRAGIPLSQEFAEKLDTMSKHNI
jgi:hypothetical protein